MRRFALLFVLAAGVAVADEKKEEKKPPTGDGTWVITSIEAGGVKAPEEQIKKQAAKLTITGDKWSLMMEGKAFSAGTTKADTTKKPIELDITTTEGPDKGKTIKAIVEHTGDTMKACYDISGTERPKEFSAPPGTKLLFVTFKREKP